MQVLVVLNGKEIVRSVDCFTVCETSHPPAWYIPRKDFLPGVLVPHLPTYSTFCEWKGHASYFDLVSGDKKVSRAAWTYEKVSDKDFGEIEGFVAIYPGLMDLCSVEGEPVIAQPSDFYGGWLTPSWVDVGPRGMKGEDLQRKKRKKKHCISNSYFSVSKGRWGQDFGK